MKEGRGLWKVKKVKKVKNTCMGDDDESVKLQSGDKEVFSVSKEVACQAVTIKEMLEGASSRLAARACAPLCSHDLSVAHGLVLFRFGFTVTWSPARTAIAQTPSRTPPFRCQMSRAPSSRRSSSTAPGT